MRAAEDVMPADNEGSALRRAASVYEGPDAGGLPSEATHLELRRHYHFPPRRRVLIQWGFI